MSKKGKCLICNTSKSVHDEKSSYCLGLPSDIYVIKCKCCGLRWLDPMKSSDEYKAIYKFSYFDAVPENYEQVVSERIRHYAERIEKIKRLYGRENIKVMDIGAATGEFVYEARKSGIDALGIEPSEKACHIAKEKYGIDLVQGDFFDIDLKEDDFDVIHINHVLEHVILLHQFINKIRKVLKPGGYLIIEVPYQFGNIIERVLRFVGAYESQPFTIYSIHHPFFYSPKSLRMLLKQSGFSVESLASWRPYLRMKLIAARKFCRFARLSFIEKYLRLFHIVLLEKGKFVFTELYARKI